MNDDQDISRRVGQALKRQSVDPKTRAALREARLRALDGPTPVARPEWLAAGVSAAMALLVVAALLSRDDTPQALPLLAADELAVIAADEDLELLEEWEFYAWFDEQPGVSG